MDSVLLHYSSRNHPIFKIYMESVEHSRTKEKALEKFQKNIRNFYL